MLLLTLPLAFSFFPLLVSCESRPSSHARFREGSELASDWSVAGQWIERLVWSEKDAILQLLTQAASSPAISLNCSAALSALHDGLLERRLWAFQMLDSTSLGDAGFINRFVDFGDYDLCLSVSAPDDLFYGRHCLARLDFALPPPALKDSITRVDISGTPMQGSWLEQCARNYKYLYFEKITTGICFPSSCQPKEMEQLLNSGRLVGVALLA